MAVTISRPANQSAVILVSSTFSRTAPVPESTRPAINAAILNEAQNCPAQRHQPETEEHDALLAELPTQPPAGKGESDSGQQVEADERAEHGVAHPQLAGELGRYRGH